MGNRQPTAHSPRPVRPTDPHLLLVVHGVGDMTYDSPPVAASLYRSLERMERSIAAASRERAHAAPATPAPHIILRTVEWHSPMQAQWAKLVSPAAPEFPYPFHNAVRATLQDSVGDLMLFMSPQWRPRLLAEVQRQIRQVYAQVRADLAHTDWNGPVSLFAHSLGSAIAFELIRDSALQDIPIDSVFCTGSPLAAYLTLQPNGLHQLRQVLLAPTSPRFYNLFHPFDPAAFRLEPFLGPVGPIAHHREAIVPPAVLMPRRRNWWDNFLGAVEQGIHQVAAFVCPLPHDDHKRRPPRIPPPPNSESTALADPAAMHEADQLEEDFFSDVSCSSSVRSLPSSGDLKQPRQLATKSGNLGLETGTLVDETTAKMRAWVRSMGGRRYDYEIDDGARDTPPLEFLIHWGCLQSHFSYWHSVDVMRFIIDRIAERRHGIRS